MAYCILGLYIVW